LLRRLNGGARSAPALWGPLPPAFRISTAGAPVQSDTERPMAPSDFGARIERGEIAPVSAGLLTTLSLQRSENPAPRHRRALSKLPRMRRCRRQPSPFLTGKFSNDGTLFKPMLTGYTALPRARIRAPSGLLREVQAPHRRRAFGDQKLSDRSPRRRLLASEGSQGNAVILQYRRDRAQSGRDPIRDRRTVRPRPNALSRPHALRHKVVLPHRESGLPPIAWLR
jgi:hypothetical protein